MDNQVKVRPWCCYLCPDCGDDLYWFIVAGSDEEFMRCRACSFSEQFDKFFSRPKISIINYKFANYIRGHEHLL